MGGAGHAYSQLGAVHVSRDPPLVIRIISEIHVLNNSATVPCHARLLRMVRKDSSRRNHIHALN